MTRPLAAEGSPLGHPAVPCLGEFRGPPTLLLEPGHPLQTRAITPPAPMTGSTAPPPSHAGRRPAGYPAGGFGEPNRCGDIRAHRRVCRGSVISSSATCTTAPRQTSRPWPRPAAAHANRPLVEAGVMHDRRRCRWRPDRGPAARRYAGSPGVDPAGRSPAGAFPACPPRPTGPRPVHGEFRLRRCRPGCVRPARRAVRGGLVAREAGAYVGASPGRVPGAATHPASVDLRPGARRLLDRNRRARASTLGRR